MPNTKSTNENPDRTSEIRSDEVQEIMSFVPHWMIRWGITVMFLLMVILIGISWMVKYPDVIKGTAVITTEKPPVKLVCKTNGPLLQLYVKDGEQVTQGARIGEIENSLNQTAIVHLQHLSDTIDKYLGSTHVITLPPVDTILVFGEFQPQYNQLIQTLQKYNELIANPYYASKQVILRQQIAHYEDLITISSNQLDLVKSELKNAYEKYKVQNQLYLDSVISRLTFLDQQALYTQKKQGVEDLKKSFVQTNITLTSYQDQYNDLEYNHLENLRELKEQILSSVKSVHNFINSWQMNYVLTAPNSGEVSYLSNWTEDQFILSGTELFAILPPHNQYVAYVKIPVQGFGKLKEGQRVNISLNNYPSHEYGLLKGTVIELGELPQISKEGDSYYLIKVSLPQDLKSTYHKQFAYSPEMSGVADVITEDLKLAERVFNQFKKVLDH